MKRLSLKKSPLKQIRQLSILCLNIHLIGIQLPHKVNPVLIMEVFLLRAEESDSQVKCLWKTPWQEFMSHLGSSINRFNCVTCFFWCSFELRLLIKNHKRKNPFVSVHLSLGRTLQAKPCHSQLTSLESVVPKDPPWSNQLWPRNQVMCSRT